MTAAAAVREQVRWPLSGGPPVEAERWRLPVPARWEEPTGPSISLAVVRLRSTRDAPPVIVLAGGPGASGIDDLVDGWPTDHGWIRRALETRDVVVFDQRGTGNSTPSTDCGLRWDLPLDRPGERSGMLDAALELARACRAGCEARGVDLGGFTTMQSVSDVGAIADALGAERFALFGASYGSHLGLAAIRPLGDRVDAAVLGLVEPLDHTFKLPSAVDRAFDTVAARTAADPRWSPILPDLRATLAAAMDDLGDGVVADATDGRPVAVGRWDAQLAIADALGGAEEIAVIPRQVRSLAEGDRTWLADAAAEWRRRPFGRAMSWVTDAASGASEARLERIRREAGTALLGDALTFPFPEMAAPWGDPDLGDGFRASFRSDTRVLFVSGALDGRTPPSNVDEILGGFANGWHVVVDGLAHDAVFDVPEVGEQALGVLAGTAPTLREASAPFTLEAP